MTTEPDPRPRIVADERGATVPGASCASCGLNTLTAAETCPSCGADLAATSFGPGGVVWSSTVVRVPIPGRTPPYPLAYVDLDAGPRLLCHLTGDERPPVGARIRLVGTTGAGDPLAEVTS